MNNIVMPRGGFRAAAIAAIVTLALLVGAGGAAAQEAADNPITIYTGNAAALAPGGLAEQLRQRAQAQGQVRVIVGLRMRMQAEDSLTPAQATTQLQALQSVQSGVAARVLGAANSQSGDRFTFIPYMSMFVNAAQLDRLLADPQVESVQEDRPRRPLLAQSAPLIHATDVWAKNFGGGGQVIAVLDTGVSKSHPMFAGKVVSEACYSTTNAASGFASLCPRGVAASTAPGSGVNCPVALDGCEHGTHVAGIAVGNAPTLDGIARGARLIAIKVFSRNTSPGPGDSDVESFTTDEIKGLERVYALRRTYKIAAVNLSLGGGKFAAECDRQEPAETAAITKLRNAGIATIVASGNDGFIGFINAPACISTAIPVGNTRKDDRLYGGSDQSRFGGSNHSDLIRLLAPGTNIKSAVPGNKYALLTGTSMAAPHVAGAFALLRQAKPNATIDEMVEALRCSGKPINRVFVPGAGALKLEPYRRRIDLIGAFYTIRNSPNFLRTWAFDKAAEASDWATVYGNWKVQSGNFVPTPPGANGVATQVSTCHTKVQVIARVKRGGTQSRAQYLETGIVVRAEGSFNAGETSGYAAVYVSCAANSSGHCTGDPDPAWPRGAALFYRIDQQKASDGFPVRRTLCRKRHTVNISGYNAIRVVSSGATHSYFLNGSLVCTVNDNTWPDGNVMLYGGPANLATYPVLFDSVSIQAVGANDPPSASRRVAVTRPTLLASP